MDLSSRADVAAFVYIPERLDLAWQCPYSNGPRRWTNDLHFTIQARTKHAEHCESTDSSERMDFTGPQTTIPITSLAPFSKDPFELFPGP